MSSLSLSRTRILLVCGAWARLRVCTGYLVKWIDTALRASPKRQNFVERWAERRGLAAKTAETETLLPLWRRMIEDIWPWEKDANRTICGPWRRKIVSELIVAKNLQVTARDLSPFLDPDSSRHKDLDAFLADSDGLAQPLLAEFGGEPCWGQDPIVYKFPETLRQQAVPEAPAKEGFFATLRRRILSWKRPAVDIPSYLEEKPPPRYQISISIILQLVFTAAAALWVPLRSLPRIEAGFRPPYVGLMPAFVARGMWPGLLVLAGALAGVSIWQSQKSEALVEEISFRNKLRYKAAWQVSRVIGRPGMVPVDLSSERWFDTAESSSDFELRQFDDKTKDTLG
eukprot:TRINITY_DN37085_c0_g1_i2.p1 TRINITY_DN37085_c0_g1~~TRINITY_DN37085_c0_g1_i2.p1  ORF type:complete len:342 (+),score=45.08 TRINITY_DN37085_c0_g1_i2:52-1077(+)